MVRDGKMPVITKSQICHWLNCNWRQCWGVQKDEKWYFSKKSAKYDNLSEIRPFLGIGGFWTRLRLEINLDGGQITIHCAA